MAEAKNIQKQCLICSKVFLTNSYRINKGQGKYCSLSCSAKAKHIKIDQSGANNANWKNGRSLNPVIYTRKYKKENPHKLKAHNTVMNALRNGSLKRGICEICGSEKVDAHHPDYTKPLEIQWLCRKHHIEFHKNM